MTAHTTGTTLSTGAERNVFEQYAEAASRNTIVGDLLKFSKGEWQVGKDQDELPEGTRLVANLDEFMVGWMKWEDGKPTDMRMGRVVDGFQPAKRGDLGDLNRDEWEIDPSTNQPRDPWQLTNYLILKETDGDRLYTFATSSKGGISAVGKLCGEYGKRLRSKPDEFPIVALNVDSYKHSNKAYGKIYVPQLDVVGWTGKAAFASALSSADARRDEGRDDGRQTDMLDPTAGRGAGRGAAGNAAATDTVRF